MTAKEAFEHNWYVGEKIWIVYHKYNSEVNDNRRVSQPVGIMEVTVSYIDRTSGYKNVWESIEVEFTGNWIIKDRWDIPYIDSHLASLVEHHDYGDMWTHSDFCTNKFFTKEDAEKRLKKEISSWNKKVIARKEQLEKRAKQAIGRSKSDLKKAEKFNIEDHLIK